MTTLIADANIPAIALVANNESVVLALGGSAGSNRTRIEGHVNVSAGTGVTDILIRVRKQGGANPQVGITETHSLAAGKSASIPFSVEDNTGYLAQVASPNLNYWITVQQVNATGDGICNGGNMAIWNVPN